MSTALKSLIYKSLQVGQGKVFSIELPTQKSIIVTDEIKRYCDQHERKCLVVDGNHLSMDKLLVGLRSLFYKQVESYGFSLTKYSALKTLLKRHQTGVICVNKAHLMSHETRQFLTKFVRFTKKNKLAWKFYFLTLRSEDAVQLNDQFKIKKRLLWNQREADWFFVEKTELPSFDPNAAKNKVKIVTSVAVVALVLICVFWFISSQPSPKKLIPNNPEEVTKTPIQ